MCILYRNVLDSQLAERRSSGTVTTCDLASNSSSVVRNIPASCCNV